MHYQVCRLLSLHAGDMHQDVCNPAALAASCNAYHSSKPWLTIVLQHWHDTCDQQQGQHHGAGDSFALLRLLLGLIGALTGGVIALWGLCREEGNNSQAPRLQRLSLLTPIHAML